MHANLRQLLLGSTSLVAGLGFATGALAQDVLETVIVTATKTATDVQKTAVSISAVTPSANKAAGQTQLYEFLTDMPSIDVHKQGGGGNRSFTIRGIGGNQQLFDGVATAGEGLGGSGLDTQRIEVLRGPQGTLYGVGAFSGVINTITNDPTDKFEGKVHFEVGALNLIDVETVVNIPLTDEFQLRIAGAAHQRAGTAHPDQRASEDYEQIRAKLRWKPSETFSIVVTAGETVSKSGATNDAYPMKTKIANYAGTAFNGFNPCGFNPKLNPWDPWHSPPKYYQAFPCTVGGIQNGVNFSYLLPTAQQPITGACQMVPRGDQWAGHVGLHMDWDVGFGTVTLLTDYSNSMTSTGYKSVQMFLGRSPGQINYSGPGPDLNAEIRLASPAADALKWLIGLYYDNGSGFANRLNRTKFAAAALPIGVTQITRSSNTTKSIFFNVTLPVTDRLRFTAGGRYHMEVSKSQAYNFNLGTRKKTTPSDTAQKARKFTYRLGLDFDINQNMLLYASTSTGFKTGATTVGANCRGDKTGFIYSNTDASGAINAVVNGGGCITGTATIIGGPSFTEHTSILRTSRSLPPDDILAYEIGSKNRFFDNKMELNLAAYHYKFPHLTISGNNRPQGDNTISPTNVNAVGTRAYGAEMELTYLLTPNDKLNFNLGYNITRAGVNGNNQPQCFNYGQVTHPQINTGNATLNAACTQKNLAANPSTVNWVRYRDALRPNDRLFQNPVWNGTATYQHVFDLDSGATLTARYSLHFESDNQTSVAYNVDGFQKSYHNSQASVAYDTADGKWGVQFWVKNIENIPVLEGAEGTTLGDDPEYVLLQDPRTWGINLDANF